MMHPLLSKAAVVSAMALGSMGVVQAAHARTDVYFSLGVPGPAYVAPQPVYVAPPTVYTAPAPVYAQPRYDDWRWRREEWRREEWRREHWRHEQWRRWHGHHDWDDRDGD